MDNPAGRLRHWLDTLDALRAQGDRPVAVLAAHLLNVEPTTTAGRAEVMRLGVALVDLCAETRREVHALGPIASPELLLSDFGQIERAVDFFTQSLNQSGGALFGQIDPAGRRGLEHIDWHLHTHRRQTWIPDETRQRLLKQAQDLITEVSDTTDLADEVKEFILTRLVEVEESLRYAEVTGTTRIERATDALIGSARRRDDLWDQIAETKWAGRVRNLVGALFFALGSVGGLPALMPGDQPQPEVTNIEIVLNNDIDNGLPSIEGTTTEVDVPDAELVEDDDGVDINDTSGQKQ